MKKKTNKFKARKHSYVHTRINYVKLTPNSYHSQYFKLVHFNIG